MTELIFLFTCIRNEGIIKQAQDYVNRLSTSIEEYKTNLTTYKVQEQELLETIHKVELECNQEVSNIMSERDSKLSDLRAKRVELVTTKSQLEKSIRDAKAVKDTCPTCGRKFDNVFIPDTSEQENELSHIISELNYLDTESSQVTNQYTDKITAVRSEYNTLVYQTRLSEVKAHIKNFETSIYQITKDKESQEKTLQQYEQLRSNYNLTVSNLNETITNSNSEIVKLNENLVYYNDSKNNIQDRLAAVTKFTTLTTRDFRGYLLKNVIQFIDNKAKEYCEDVFENRNIDFVLDGNNIDIKYCGKQYEACSGGEKQKVDLIVQFAIRDMLCKFLDFSSSIIVLDEIFDNLDTTGCEKIINLISRKLVDIQSIFIITHHNDLQIPEDSKITVTKQPDGVSLVV